MNYWKECIEDAFSEANIEATQEQINIVIDNVRISHENIGLLTGSDCIPNPTIIENDKLKNELKREQNKKICYECNGKGYTRSYGGSFQAESDCYKCNGTGFIY